MQVYTTSDDTNRLNSIPEELRQRNQWVCWRWVFRDGKWTKQPVNPNFPSKLARTDDKTTWGSFEQALKIYEANPTLAGIGYVFSADDEYLGVDFDGCIDGGEIDPFAKQWLDRLGGYQESSVSLTGIHAVVRASKAKDSRNRKRNPGGNVKEVEVYDRERFFVFTGRIRKGFDSVDESQQAIDEFLNSLFPPKARRKPRARIPTNIDDEELLDRARNSASGRKFMRLYDKGDTSSHPSPSEADFALINMLIFWCAGDGERIARLFEQSALYRDEKHSNYVADSVANALDSYKGEFYDERRSRQAVERALPPYLDLLLQPIWNERKAVSAFKAFAGLLIMAPERGVKVDEGIRVGVDIYSLAEVCNVGVDTLSKNALPWLIRRENGLVRWRRGKGDRAGYFILLAPAVESNPIYPHGSIYRVGLYAELRQLIRLCYGRSKKSIFGRLGSLAAMVLLPLVIAGRELKLDELCEITGRKQSHLKSVVAKLVDADLVVEAREGVYRLPTDFWERFDSELDNSGITESERLRKRRHDAHREGRKLYKGKPADKVPPPKPKPSETTVETTAEVFVLARRFFPNRDGLPSVPPPPRMRDPMVHTDTDKVRFFKGRVREGV